MRASWISMLALACGACGDNIFPDGEPLAQAANLTIVAHQDDDLLFLQPDLYQAVQSGAGVTNVYVTAGSSMRGLHTVEDRYAGLKAAYSAITGDDDWTYGWIQIGDNLIEHYRLPGARLSLVLVGYPDGGKEGDEPTSLIHLWEGKVERVDTVSRQPTTYDRDSVIQVLSEIIDATAPTTLRTLEIASTHGRDHPDHSMVGALSLLATARSHQAPALISYRGYNIDEEPANTDPAALAQPTRALAYYHACASGCAPCGQACSVDELPDYHTNWLARRYPVAMRQTAEGPLRLDDRCVDVTTEGANAALGACQAAPTWQLDARGSLRSGELCLRALPTGELVGAPCGDTTAASRFFLDEEGHLWTGVVPPPEDDMAYAHLDCVIASGGRPRAALCGEGRAPVWSFP